MGDQGFAGREGRHGLPAALARLRRQQDHGRRGEMAVQVGGKLRGTITVPVDSEGGGRGGRGPDGPKVQKFTEGKELVKTILVPNKLVNLIAK